MEFPLQGFSLKGVVHGIEPYGRIRDNLDSVDEFGSSISDLENGRQEKMGVSRSRFKKNLRSGSDEDNAKTTNLLNERRSGEGSKGKLRKKGSGRRICLVSSSDTIVGLDSRVVGMDQEKIGRTGGLRKMNTLVGECGLRN